MNTVSVLFLILLGEEQFSQDSVQYYVAEQSVQTMRCYVVMSHRTSVQVISRRMLNWRLDTVSPDIASHLDTVSPDLASHLTFQCGRGYSCLKVVQQPRIFDVYGQFVPLPERKQTEEVVYRGCFVLDIHKVTTVFIVKLSTKFSHQDLCYVATSGLQYCWCSSKDLCNLASSKHQSGRMILGLIIMKYLQIL